MCSVKSSWICETQLPHRLGHSGVMLEMPAAPNLSSHTLIIRRRGLGNLGFNKKNDSTKSGAFRGMEEGRCLLHAWICFLLAPPRLVGQPGGSFCTNSLSPWDPVQVSLGDTSF